MSLGMMITFYVLRYPQFGALGMGIMKQSALVPFAVVEGRNFIFKITRLIFVLFFFMPNGDFYF